MANKKITESMLRVLKHHVTHFTVPLFAGSGNNAAVQTSAWWRTARALEKRGYLSCRPHGCVVLPLGSTQLWKAVREAPAGQRNVSALAFAVVQLESKLDEFKDIEDIEELSKVDLRVLRDNVRELSAYAVHVFNLCNDGLAAEGR